MGDRAKKDMMGGGGLVVVGLSVALFFLIFFLFVPLKIGVGFIRSRLALGRGVSRFRRAARQGGTLPGRLLAAFWDDPRRRIQTLPALFALVFTVFGRGAMGPAAFAGGFLGLLLFAYLPFVGFFGPLENALGLLRGKLLYREKSRVPGRVLLLAAFLAVGAAAMMPVEQSASLTRAANQALASHAGKHYLRYKPQNVSGVKVPLAMHLADRAMVEGGPVLGPATAGLVSELMWINIFTFNVAMRMELDKVFEMLFLGGSRSCKGVVGPLYLGWPGLGHRQVLGWNLAIFGFGGALWLALSLAEIRLVRAAVGKR